MMTYTYSDELYSDLHKDTHGVRPGEIGFNFWNSLTPNQKQVHWDSLCDQMAENEAYERKREAAAVAAFETQVRENIELGAGDRETAIRWIVQSGGWENEYDPGYICYCLGLPYSMESVFKPFIGQETA